MKRPQILASLIVSLLLATACPRPEEQTAATDVYTATGDTTGTSMSSAPPPANCTQPSSPKKHPVTVWVQRTGADKDKVFAKPHRVDCVYPKDTVVWTTEDGRLNIKFSNPNDPVPKKKENRDNVDHTKIKYTNGHHVASWEVTSLASDADGEIYEYLVTVEDKHDGNKNKESDPEVDIREVIAVIPPAPPVDTATQGTTP